MFRYTIALLLAAWAGTGADLSKTPKVDFKADKSDPRVYLPGFWTATAITIETDEDGNRRKTVYTVGVKVIYIPELERFGVHWAYDGAPMVGIGLLDANKLVIGWSWVTVAMHHRGVTILDLGGGKVRGRWAMGPGRNGTESWERVGDLKEGAKD